MNRTRPLVAIILALALTALAGCAGIVARGQLLITLNEDKPLPANLVASPTPAIAAGATPTGILSPIPTMPAGTRAAWPFPTR